MKIGILLFDNMTALDAVGPYEVLARINNAQVYFIGIEKKVYKDYYGLKLLADYSIDEINNLDILLIPGGYGIDILLENLELKNWIRLIDQTTKYTVSVCSGALLLAVADLLEGKRCTTHWRRKEQLKKHNVIIEEERYVHDGKMISSAGVSAGIDMALYLVSLIEGEQAAQLIQLGIEYDPMPPFDCGAPKKVSLALMEQYNKKLPPNFKKSII